MSSNTGNSQATQGIKTYLGSLKLLRNKYKDIC